MITSSRGLNIEQDGFDVGTPASGEVYPPRHREDRWLDAAVLVMLSHTLGPLTHLEADKVAACERLERYGLVQWERSDITGGMGRSITSHGRIAAKAFEDVMGLRA